MHKAEAEEKMAARWPQMVICRMPLMFGDPGPVAKSCLQPIVQALREGRELRMFVDEFRTPASGSSAAEGLLLALRKGSGIVHLGGRERLSRFDLATMVAKALGSTTPITPVNQDSVPMAAPRPKDVSLNSSRAFGMGYSPLSAQEEISRILATL